MPARGVARVQLDAAAEFVVSRLEVPVEAIETERQRNVRLAERAVELQRLNGCRTRRDPRRACTGRALTPALPAPVATSSITTMSAMKR